MKARIKRTGEVINIAPYARVELDVCDSRGDPITMKYDEIELVQDLVQDNDWQSFRREAAKDILPAVIAKKSSMCSYDEVVKEAIEFTDELIKVLRNG